MIKLLRKQANSITAGEGFTLIELLVSIALLSIVGGIGISVFAIINTSYNQSNALSLMQSQGSQVLEVMERSIRGSSGVETATNGQSGCLDTHCLVVEVPTSSIEYSINGQCSYTIYGWTGERSSSPVRNGTLSRYYVDNYGSLCNGSVPIVLFDDDPRHGISVQQLDGDIFKVVTGNDGIDSVNISFNLSSGVAISADHANVPLRTTVGLRDY